MKNSEIGVGAAKIWIKPELKRLEAGAAENTRPSTNPDGCTSDCNVATS